MYGSCNGKEMAQRKPTQPCITCIYLYAVHRSNTPPPSPSARPSHAISFSWSTFNSREILISIVQRRNRAISRGLRQYLHGKRERFRRIFRPLSGRCVPFRSAPIRFDPTARCRPFPVTDRGFYRGGKLLTPKEIDRGRGRRV